MLVPNGSATSGLRFAGAWALRAQIEPQGVEQQVVQRLPVRRGSLHRSGVQFDRQAQDEAVVRLKLSRPPASPGVTHRGLQERA
jgi:hypothetical protein